MAEKIVTLTRVCRKCGVEKSLTCEHFHTTNGKAHTWRHVCKACRREEDRERNGWKAQGPKLSAEEVRRRARDGCKRWYSQNADRQAARIQAGRRNDPEFHKGRDKFYYERHKDAKKARAADYRKRNPENVQKWNREWRERNGPRKRPPEQNAEYLHRRRFRLGRGQGLTASDIRSKTARQSGLCYYCEAAKKLTVEHFVPLSRGGLNEPANVVMACASCNYSKGKKLPWEWKPDRFQRDCEP